MREKWTEGHIRALLTLYDNTDHGRFDTQQAEADYYSAIIGRRVTRFTVGAIMAGKWYAFGPAGEIVKGENWKGGKASEAVQPELFPNDETQDKRAELRAVLEELADLMAKVSAVSEKAAAIWKELER